MKLKQKLGKRKAEMKWGRKTGCARALLMAAFCLVLAALPLGAAPGAPATSAMVSAGTQPYLWVTPANLNGAALNLKSITLTNTVPFNIGTGIGAGLPTAIDGAAGLRMQPGNGTGNGYQFLDQGANNVLNIWGGVGSISLGQNLGDISGAYMPFWQTLQWGDPSNGGWSHVGYQGYAITDYGLHGGNGGGLEDLPTDVNEVAAALPTPPFVLTTTYLLGAPPNQNTNETQITNMIGMAATSGIIAMVTNAGGQFWVHFDDGAHYFSDHRDGSAQNLLSINTTAFPDSSNTWPNMRAYYGVKVLGTVYTWPYPTNEVDGNGVGLGSGYPNTPFLTPNSIDYDISKLYDFGLDGIRIADLNTTIGGQQQYSRHVTDAVLYPVFLGNYTTGKKTYSLMINNGGKGVTTPLMTEMMGYNVGGIANSMFKQANLIDHDVDVSAYPWPGANTNIGLFTHRVMQNFRGLMQYEVPFRGPGHFGPGPGGFLTGDPFVNDTRVILTDCAIGMSKVMFSYNVALGTSLAVQRPNFLSNATNAAFLSVMFDKKCQVPYNVFDNGWSNTSAWCRPLAGGAFAVGLVNETMLFSNITVNLGACQIPTNMTYTVSDVWSNASFVTSANTFTYTNCAPTNCALLVFRPTPQNYGQVPAVSFNWAQIPPFSLTQTNYWVGNWTNGTVCAIYSNTVSTYAIKQLAP